MADPCFLGAVIACNADSGSKVVAKADPHERVGVLCHEDGKPSIVEYYEMTDEMIESHEPDGRLSYNYGVILNYLFKTDILNKIVDKELPLHKAFKKIKYIDKNGNIVFPSVNNAYKFETLVLDMVKLQDSCLAFEVERDKEFAPIKNKTGVDSVDTARELSNTLIIRFGLACFFCIRFLKNKLYFYIFAASCDCKSYLLACGILILLLVKFF